MKIKLIDLVKVCIVLMLSLSSYVNAKNNLLINGGFEKTHGFPQYWFAIGNGAQPRVALVDKQSYRGKHSVFISERSEPWMAIGQNITGKLVKNVTYDISIWAKLGDEVNTAKPLQVTIKKVDDSGTTYKQIAKRDVSSDTWVELAGNYVLSYKGELKELILYVEAAEANVSYYLDYANLKEINSNINRDKWLKETNKSIERIRKRDVAIQFFLQEKPLMLIDKAHVNIKQVSNHFMFGSALASEVKNNKVYADFFLKNFEWAVFENELKWGHTEAKKGRTHYDDADVMVKFAQKNGIKLRGHTLFWAVDEFVQDWVKLLTPDDLHTAMAARVKSLLTTKYHGVFEQWDVNNEMLHGNFFQNKFVAKKAFNPRKYMFDMAANHDPNAQLFTNDYDIISPPYLTDEYIHSIAELTGQGAKVSGIGVQGHFEHELSITRVQQALDHLASLNLPIVITEFDVDIVDEAKQAESLEILYRTAFAHPQVEGVLMWGFWEKRHWRPNGAIADKNWRLKPAGHMYQALRNEWRSNISTTYIKKPMEARVFHGEYQVTLTAGSESYVGNFTVLPGQKRQNIEVNLVLQ